jgi:hypothetical protein
MALSKLGPGLLTFGEAADAKEFGVAVSEATLAPEFDSDDPISLLSGDEVPGDETETWTLTFTKYQDYTAESLDLWLYDNSGEELPFTFVPDKAGKLQAKGRVVIRAGSLGGEVKKRNTSELELPVVGRPVITADYAAAPEG